MRSVNEDRLQKTLDFILEYQKAESKTPTYRQIQKECGYTSLGTVAADVARLKKRHLMAAPQEREGRMMRINQSPEKFNEYKQNTMNEIQEKISKQKSKKSREREER